MAHVHKMYEYDYNTMTIKRKFRACPRCGSPMGYHKQPRPRWHCGKCGYTEYVREGK